MISTAIQIKVSPQEKIISPLLFGIFFEDLNYAADGGLYAELIQNRSFEYHATEQPTWNSLTCWELIQRGGGSGRLVIDAGLPVDKNNPNCLVLGVEKPGEGTDAGVGVANPGFDGIVVKAGETYDLSFFSRQLWMNDRWGPGSAIDGKSMPIVLRLESASGEVLGEASVTVTGAKWQKYSAEIVATTSDPAAKFVLLAKARGGITLDEVSLFPRKTFKNRKNGLRADLAQVIADLKPRFVRFPGGCLAHGHSVGNIYHWKHTIGPIEERKGQSNLWGYHQSMGLGYFEYFQFCEDIGAKPVPVVAAGVSCQNSCHTSGVGQQCIPMEEMPAYIQDILDLIEWANGPVDSKWGSKRAAAGHPEPFNLEYLGVGNEDHITPGFKERFQMIQSAIDEKHPEITVIGTSGPFHSGEDYDKGWEIARELKVPMIDEHYYETVDWFWNNLTRYDQYDRLQSKVYLGEYAAHEPDRKSTLRSALAEAAYMTSLERNGDVVYLASYAPLLGKRDHMQWRPDLIYFDNTTINLTPNYFVQKLFSEHAGDRSLAVTTPESKTLAVSCVRHSKTRETILKMVSRSDSATAIELDLSSIKRTSDDAQCITLSGDPLGENPFGEEPKLVPKTTQVRLGPSLTIPPHSLTVIRIR